MIGNAATFASSTQREIQIPKTTWNNEQIQITVNKGAFNSGDPAYLYVIDSTGAVNATGYAITFGGGTPSDTTAPSAPSGLATS
jgi:hypothetical protein